MCEVEDVQIYWTWIGKTIKQNRMRGWHYGKGVIYHREKWSDIYAYQLAIEVG